MKQAMTVIHDNECTDKEKQSRKEEVQVHSKKQNMIKIHSGFDEGYSKNGIGQNSISKESNSSGKQLQPMIKVCNDINQYLNGERSHNSGKILPPMIKVYDIEEPMPTNEHYEESITEKANTIQSIANSFDFITIQDKSLLEFQTDSNDTGNTEFILNCLRSNIIYVIEDDRFRFWNGKAWVVIELLELKRIVMDMIQKRFNHSKLLEYELMDEDFLLKSGNNNKIDSVVELLKTQLCIRKEALNTADYILCVRNGVINFRTQTLEPHIDYKHHYITKMVDVDYNPFHQDKFWTDFICSVMSYDTEKAVYLQKAFGAAILGNPKEQKVYMLKGTGSNGKSTLINAIRNTLTSEFVCEMSIRLITGSDTRNANASSSAVAALEDKLIAFSSEVDKDDVLNEAKFKKLCSKGKISAREVYKKQREFEPKFTLFIDTNYLMKIKNASSKEAFAVFRRIVIIPFNNTFDKNKDINLGELLRTESAKMAILNWLIQGAFDYMRNPTLLPTTEMEEALNHYMMMENNVSGFIRNCITVTDNPKDTILSTELYNCYCTYCTKNGLSPVLKDTFSKYGDFRNYDKHHTSKGTAFRGIKVNV